MLSLSFLLSFDSRHSFKKQVAAVCTQLTFTVAYKYKNADG